MSTGGTENYKLANKNADIFRQLYKYFLRLNISYVYIISSIKTNLQSPPI